MNLLSKSSKHGTSKMVGAIFRKRIASVFFGNVPKSTKAYSFIQIFDDKSLLNIKHGTDIEHFSKQRCFLKQQNKKKS